MIEESLRISNVIKINERELTVLQSYFNLHKETLTAVNQLLEKFNISLIAVTFGKDGAILSNQESTDYYRSESLEVIDTLGAGDAYSAIVCIGYLFNMEMQKTNLLANQFALDICRTLGALASDEIYEKYKSLLFQTE